MKNSLFVVSFFIALIITSPAKSAVPNIGDNSLFACEEDPSLLDPKSCRGEVRWISDQNGVSRDSVVIKPKKARS